MGMSPRLELHDFGELLRERAWLDRLVAGMVREAPDRDDIAQRALVHCIEARGTIRNLKAYLASVARGFALNRHRERVTRERREQIAAEPEISPQSDPALLAERAELQQQVIEALLELEEPRRTVLLLRFHGDVSTAVIASKLGIPAPTVRSHLRRGLEQLRDRFDRDPSRRPWRAILLPTVSTRTAGVAAALFTGGMLVKWKIAAAVVAASALSLVGITLLAPASDSPRLDLHDSFGAPPDVGTKSSLLAIERVPTGATDDANLGPPVESAPKPEPRVATLYGRVIREDSLEPIRDVEIAMFDELYPVSQPKVVATSGGDGSYRIENVQVDRGVFFRLRPPRTIASICSVSLTDAGEQHHEFRLEREIVVAGRVVDSTTREPIAGATVSVSFRQSEGSRGVDLIADESGAIRFSAAASLSRRLILNARHPGYSGTKLSLAEEGEFELPMLKAARVEGIARRADGSIARDLSVRLAVLRVEPSRIPTEVLWTTECTTTDGDATARVDEYGRFSFESVAPWSEVVVETWHKPGEKAHATAKTGAPGSTASVELIQVPSVGSSVIEGLLTVNGRPEPVPYQLMVNGRAIGSGLRAGPDGRFRHESLAAGRAMLTAEIPGMSVSREYELRAGSFALAEIALKLETSWVSGRVVRSDGSPVPVIGVAIRAKNREWRVGVKTDESGVFRVITPLAPGEPAVARIFDGGLFHEREFRGGDEACEFVLSERGWARLRIVDRATQSPLLDPAIRIVDPSGERRELQGRSIRALPGDVKQIELEVGTHTLEVDRSRLFYSPATVNVTASIEPGEWIVAVPAQVSGVLRIEFDDDASVSMPKRAMGHQFRVSGSNEGFRAVSTLAYRFEQREFAELELPCGTHDFGVWDFDSKSVVELASSITIAADQKTVIRLRRSN